MEKEKFERWVEISPAYDKKAEGYGIHSAELRFLLKGKHGVIQFVIYTGWFLPHVQDELWVSRNPRLLLSPMPADIGYHSPVQKYEGQEPITDNCHYLDGKPCYYDGSSLNARPIFDKMVAKGHESMWGELEEYYNRTFLEEANND